MFRFNIDDYLRCQKYYATENRYRTIEKAIRVINERQWVDENEYDYDDKDENTILTDILAVPNTSNICK